MRFEIPQISPMAKTWLKAEAIGCVAFGSLKFFPLFNPSLGLALTMTTFLAKEIGHSIFHDLFEDKYPFFEYVYDLFLSTLALHTFVYLAFPTVSLLELDVSYIILRTALTITYLVGDALFLKHKSQTR